MSQNSHISLPVKHFGQAGGFRSFEWCQYATQCITRLVLIDEDGEHRAELRVGEAGPMFALRDVNGVTRASLKADSTGPSLVMYEEAGTALWPAP